MENNNKIKQFDKRKLIAFLENEVKNYYFKCEYKNIDMDDTDDRMNVLEDLETIAIDFLKIFADYCMRTKSKKIIGIFLKNFLN